MTVVSPRPERQSQEQRRTATVGKVVEAAVASLAEVGYTKTTIARVSELAGVSQGGLSRHFPTRLDLMAASAASVAEARMSVFWERVVRSDVSTQELLQLLREACRSPLNAAWYELFTAARTDAALLEQLTPIAVALHDQVRAIGAVLPRTKDLPASLRDTLMFTILHLFDGEALSAVVVPHPEQEDQRLLLIEQLLDAADSLAQQGHNARGKRAQRKT